MSTHTPHQRRLRLWSAVASEVAKEMTERKWRVAQETIISLACIGLIFYAMRNGYPVTSWILGVVVGVINTVEAAQLYRAFREVQAENRHRAQEDSGD
jgi:thiamine transporter ThiT